MAVISLDFSATFSWPRSTPNSMGNIDHVNGAFAAVPWSAYRLPVDGNRAVQGGYEAADPAAERSLEVLRVKHAEDAQKGVLRRIPVLQYQELAQPRFLLARPEGGILDGVAIREHGGNNHHQDIPEVVQDAMAGTAWIIDLGQTTHQGDPVACNHAHRPKGESRCDFQGGCKMLA